MPEEVHVSSDAINTKSVTRSGHGKPNDQNKAEVAGNEMGHSSSVRERSAPAIKASRSPPPSPPSPPPKVACTPANKFDFEVQACDGGCAEASRVFHCKMCKCKQCTFCSAASLSHAQVSKLDLTKPRLALKQNATGTTIAASSPLVRPPRAALGPSALGGTAGGAADRTTSSTAHRLATSSPAVAAGNKRLVQKAR